MKHTYLLTIIVFLCSLNASAQKKVETWLDAAIKTKAEIQQTLKRQGMPVVSSYMKSGDKAETFKVNVSGLDKLYLYTDGGADGGDWDHAEWADAKLYDAKGIATWLDEIDYEYGHSGWGNPVKNKDISGNSIEIAGTVYKHGLSCHANGLLIYNLNKKYTTFEAQVGIDNASKQGSVYFKALNISTATYSNKLIEEYGDKIGRLRKVIPSLDTWLITPNTNSDIEKEALYKTIALLNDGSYFTAKAKEIDALNDNVRGRKYLELFDQVMDVVEVQNGLASLNLEAIKDAYADMKKMPNFNISKYQPIYNRIIEISNAKQNSMYKGDLQAVVTCKELLNDVRSLMLGNPLLDMDKIIVERYRLGNNARSAMSPEMGTQVANYSDQQSARRYGFNAEIIELSDLRGEGKERLIYKPDTTASITDMHLHWDAKRIMFTSIAKDHRWNLFEVNIDGGQAKPLIDTEEKDLEFFDGTYLPDGRIIAISNVGYQGVPCVDGDDAVGNTVLYNPKDKSMRRLTFDQDANWNPTIMPNGKVMFSRWEYTDLTHYYSRFVMHMNPDGTEQKALYGSGSMFPNSTFDVHTLPGHPTAFVGIISGHHGIARSGRMILFDPAKARTGAAGMTQEIMHSKEPVKELIKDQLVAGVWPQFIRPFPLSDKYFLVAAKPGPKELWGIYLVDVFDNMTLIKECDGQGFISPIPVIKQTTPPSIPDKINLKSKDCTVFIQDLYEGEGLRGVKRGEVKQLRVFTYEFAYVKSESNHLAQGIQTGWDIKRLLGTVPVEEDGSVIFKAPANTPLSLQPLDSNGAAIQWMRSWLTGMPGETVSCVGCHEDQNKIPIPKRVMASQRPAHEITAPEGGTRSFTFTLEMQPILDRACVACHNSSHRLDFTGGRYDELGYSKTYLNIHPYVHRQGPEADMPVLSPYEYHASTSELVRMLKAGHNNVKLTQDEWKTIYNWIDFNAPDKGMFVDEPLNLVTIKGVNQYKRRQELANKYGNGTAIDWRKEISDYADFLKAKGEIKAVMPEKTKPSKTKEVSVKNWPISDNDLKAMISTDKTMEIEIAPGVKMKFVRIPAGEFVMGDNSRGNSYNKPAFKAKVEKDFWMAEVEVTNAQYCALCPEHDSRYVDQFWKDHTRPGYPANLPEQPVIRVSWNEAINYCKLLSEKTGLNITLPTETQWEWAARAGKDTPFWFGDINADFSKYENMADEQLVNMAVKGIDPQPMSHDAYWFKYFNFIPRNHDVDDGSMIQSDSKKWQHNPFGLYGMNGNISEWTSSDFKAYPYPEKAKTAIEDKKVVRGGSYWERPKFCASYNRKAFLPWQRNNLVGFRVIIDTEK